MPKQNQKHPGEYLRIIIPALTAVLLFIFSAFFLFLPGFEKSLLDDKRKTSKELVMSAWHMVQHLGMEMDKGTYSPEEAREISKSLLREMRYGTDNKNYFWIIDHTPKVVMHPYRPDLEGQEVSQYKDPSGRMFFNDIVRMAREQHQGYVGYEWQWMDDKSRILPKHSFIKEYRPWGWIIGTGIYLEDAELEISLMTKRMIAASIIILTLVTILASYQIYLALNAMHRRRKAEKELLDYKELLEIKVKRRTAELTKANEALADSEERFHSLSDAAFEGIVITEKGRILEVNDTFCSMFGYQSPELITKDVFDLISPEIRKYAKDKILSGHEKAYESCCLRKDGSTFPVEVQAKMFSYKGKQARVTAIRDISARKRAEEEIKRLRGILPLCSFCKKFRDDEGYWEQVDVYIKKYSQANISHSVCPECAKLHYPGLYKKIESRLK